MKMAVRTRWNLSFAAFAAVLSLLTAPGCYSSRTRLPGYAKSIAVPVFANKTYIDEYTRKLEVEITESTRKALLVNGKLAVQGRESADLIMEGSINKYDRRILRADRYGEPAEVQIVIQATISVYDVKSAKYLVQGVVVTNDQEKTGYGSYNLRRGEDEALARKQAIEEIGRVISHKALDY